MKKICENCKHYNIDDFFETKCKKGNKINQAFMTFPKEKECCEFSKEFMESENLRKYEENLESVSIETLNNLKVGDVLGYWTICDYSDSAYDKFDVEPQNSWYDYEIYSDYKYVRVVYINTKKKNIVGVSCNKKGVDGSRIVDLSKDGFFKELKKCELSINCAIKNIQCWEEDLLGDDFDSLQYLKASLMKFKKINI